MVRQAESAQAPALARGVQKGAPTVARSDMFFSRNWER